MSVRFGWNRVTGCETSLAQTLISCQNQGYFYSLLPFPIFVKIFSNLFSQLWNVFSLMLTWCRNSLIIISCAAFWVSCSISVYTDMSCQWIGTSGQGRAGHWGLSVPSRKPSNSRLKVHFASQFTSNNNTSKIFYWLFSKILLKLNRNEHKIT